MEKKIPKIAIRGHFSWEINYNILWELLASGAGIVIGYLFFLFYQDEYIFVLFALSGYIGARILIWIYKGGFC